MSPATRGRGVGRRTVACLVFGGPIGRLRPGPEVELGGFERAPEQRRIFDPELYDHRVVPCQGIR